MRDITTRRIDEILRELYLPLFVQDLFDDPTKPWLPESYWREQHVELERKQVRRSEDEWLADNASVEDLLEEGIEPLLGNSEVLGRSNWGRMPMKHAYGSITKAPTPGEQQPSYDFECFQCGRPITAEGFDHAHRTKCDHTLVDLSTVLAEDFWPDHQAKAWHGEEEDDEDDE